MPDNATDEFFQTCRYSSHSIDCPIFRLETIVNAVGVNYMEMANEVDSRIKKFGAVFFFAIYVDITLPLGCTYLILSMNWMYYTLWLLWYS